MQETSPWAACSKNTHGRRNRARTVEKSAPVTAAKSDTPAHDWCARNAGDLLSVRCAVPKPGETVFGNGGCRRTFGARVNGGDDAAMPADFRESKKSRRLPCVSQTRRCLSASGSAYQPRIIGTHGISSALWGGRTWFREARRVLVGVVGGGQLVHGIVRIERSLTREDFSQLLGSVEKR